MLNWWQSCQFAPNNNYRFFSWILCLGQWYLSFNHTLFWLFMQKKSKFASKKLKFDTAMFVITFHHNWIKTFKTVRSRKFGGIYFTPETGAIQISLPVLSTEPVNYYIYKWCHIKSYQLSRQAITSTFYRYLRHSTASVVSTGMDTGITPMWKYHTRIIVWYSMQLKTSDKTSKEIYKAVCTLLIVIL